MSDVPSRRSKSSTSGYSPLADQQAITARLDSEVYTGLNMAADALGSSVNSLINTISRSYLRSAEGQAALTAAQKKQQEAIRKLAGG